jgi:hypothetical protein
MVNRLFLIVVLIFGNYIYAQKSDCKVTKADISGSYSGDCKNGLAHGKGVAQGTDRYEGQFIKGMPDGRGTYRWEEGTYYKGQWKNGMRDGMGKMVYSDSVVTGYWKDDKYLGEKLIPPFKIINSRSVSRSIISKSINAGSGVKIRILQGGSDNTTIEDFSLAYDSGEEYRMGNTFGIQNTLFPLDVIVKYRSWNLFHTAQYDVIFEFTIYDPGTWDVVITN